MAPQPRTKQVPANPQAELSQHPALTKAIAAAATDAAADYLAAHLLQGHRDSDRGQAEPRTDRVQGNHRPGVAQRDETMR